MIKMQLKTFPKGGLHPADNKISANKQIESLSVPETVLIPLSQHLGAPATPVVQINDTVQVGQLIAKSSGFISANIHSSVSGTIKKFDKATDTSGYRTDCFFIKVEGDQWLEGIDKSNSLKKECTLSADEIKQKVFDAGIVGLGGATFPSHVKLSTPKDKIAEYLIINGAECEPYLTSDHQLMLEKSEEIIVGVSILMKALSVDKALIGIENNKINAIKNLSKMAEYYSGIEINALKTQYPQGGEKQLVKSLIDREIPPPPGLPIDVGCVVFNVGTVFAIYEAVQKNKPLIERIVTVTGKSLEKPSNYLVRLGTPISKLIEASGGLPADTGKIIIGGPMMGKATADMNIPVTKGTSGVLILPENESKRKQELNCIKCAKCVSVCPLGLEPYLLAKICEKKLFDKAEEEQVINCMECGCCSYICPSNRPLLDYIRYGKTTVMNIIRNRNK
ncbi:MAG: electron transport complex subunit RsxC [Thermodesulfobacteriota bacterium]|nr:electron transport complex subunit RsxC [Thermodesulfobacteriota bacterium]